MGQRYSGARSYGRDRGLSHCPPSPTRGAWSASWPRCTPSRAPSGRSCARTTSAARAPGAPSSAVRARRPPEAAHVAPCDQDDVWHPSKLATLSAALSAGRHARLLRPPDRGRRRGACSHRPTGPIAWPPGTTSGPSFQTNVVTGAACLVRREVLDLALPFPAELAGSFHDHWLAVCALALGDLAYVDRALVDYVQHDAQRAWAGPSAAGAAIPPAASRIACARRATASAISSARGCGRARCSSAAPDIAPRKRRALERAARAGLPWLAAGALREQLRPRRTSKRGGGRCAARCGGEARRERTAQAPAGQSAAGSSPASLRRGSGTASGGPPRGPCGPRRSGPRRRPGPPAWWPCRAASSAGAAGRGPRARRRRRPPTGRRAPRGSPRCRRGPRRSAGRRAGRRSRRCAPGPRPRAGRARGRSSRGSGARRRRCAPRAPA